MIMKRLGKAVLLMLLMCSTTGLLSCSSGNKYTPDDLTSVKTNCVSTSDAHSYDFSLDKRDDDWFLSSECYINGYTEQAEFTEYRIEHDDAAELMKLLSTEGIINNLKKYRESLFKHQADDETVYYSTLTFKDGESICKKTTLDESLIALFYSLTEKYSVAAQEKLYEDIDNLVSVSISSNSMYFPQTYSFSIEQNGDEWRFTFECDLNPLDGGERVEVYRCLIDSSVADEIKSILEKSELFKNVQKYKESEDTDSEVYALDETTYSTSFVLKDGSCFSAPVEADKELKEIFYKLAEEYKYAESDYDK